MKNEFLTLVSRLAAEKGIKAYFVGGGLRDVLMDREMEDLDFVLSGAPGELPTTFARKIGGTFFWLDEQRFQARVVRKGSGKVLTFDFALQRGRDIVQDLLLRDFTINALALSLVGETPSLIDPCNGMGDLRKGVIRTCSEASFDDDPLRLLRALRFSTVLGFSIEPGTWRKIREKAPLVQKLASERIRDELFRMLETSNAGIAMGRLHQSGLLSEILPSCSALEENGAAPAEQRLNNVLQVEHVMGELARYFPDTGEQTRAYLCYEVEAGVTIASLMKLAVLLGANESPQRMAAETADKLRLGCKARRVLEILVREVEPVWGVPGWKPTARAAYRFFRDREPAGLAVLIIALARGFLPGDLCAEMTRYFFVGYPAVREENLLSGEEIMAILGIGPGRLVGEAMGRLRYAERAGLVNNKEQARDFIGKNLLTKDESVI